MADLRIVFYVGDNTQPLSNDRDAIADELLAETFGGSTRQKSRGSWNGPNGLEFEPSVRFEVLTVAGESTIESAGKIAEELRKLYRQNEVLYSIDSVFLNRARAPQSETQIQSDNLRESPSYKTEEVPE